MQGSRSIRDTRDRTYAFILAYGVAVLLLELARHWPTDWNQGPFAFGLFLYPLGVACLLAIGRRFRRILADRSLLLVSLATVGYLAFRTLVPAAGFVYASLAIGSALYWYRVARPQWVLDRPTIDREPRAASSSMAPLSKPHRPSRGLVAPARRRARSAGQTAPIRDAGYCLRCYAPLREPGARDVCPSCGFVNIAAMRRVYWTREPKLVGLETTIKCVLGLLCVLLSVGAVLTGGGTPAGGFALAAPVMITAILWPTVSKITQHVAYLNGRIFWSIAFGLLSIPGVAGLSLVPVLMPVLLLFGYRQIDGRAETVLILAGMAVSFVLFWVALLGTPKLRRWKARRIASGGWTPARNRPPVAVPTS